MSEHLPEVALRLLMQTPFRPFVITDGKDGLTAYDSEGFYLHAPQGVHVELRRWRRRLDLQGVTLLYQFGIGLGHSYEDVKEWLHQEKSHRLVFIEDELGALLAMARMPHALEILAHPQVEIVLVSEKEGKKGEWEEALEDLARRYPRDRVEVAALPAYARERASTFTTVRKKLLRKSGFFNALFSEALHGHRVFSNLVSNLKHLEESFDAHRLKGKFTKIPAIICGAGPSLSHHFETLKSLENQALIIAGGSAVAALSKNGVMPHLSIAVDPNEEEFHRFTQSLAFEVPFLYAGRLHPKVFATFNAPLGYMRTDTGGLAESWIEEELGIREEAIGPEMGREAFSVTTLALSYAVMLGCDPIILLGVDLAYTGGVRYATGVQEQSSIDWKSAGEEKRALERLLYRQGQKGARVATLMKWIMEADVLSNFAKTTKGRRFFNGSEDGLGFRHIPYRSLQELSQEFMQEKRDLRALLQKEIDAAPLALKRSPRELLLEMQGSLKRANDLLEQLQNETNILCEEDLKEELIFPLLLEGVLFGASLYMDQVACSPEERRRQVYKHLLGATQAALKTIDEQI